MLIRLDPNDTKVHIKMGILSLARGVLVGRPPEIWTLRGHPGV